MIAAIVLAAGLVLKTNDIQAIDISAAWGRSETAREKVHIARTDLGFTRAGAGPVDKTLIDDLVRALNSPKATLPVHFDDGLMREAFTARRPKDAQCSTDDVLARFERATEVDFYRRFGVKDVVSLLDVTVRTSNAVIRVWSYSQHPLMIPFEMYIDGKKTLDYDTRLSFALDALMPHSATSQHFLVDGMVGDVDFDACNAAAPTPDPLLPKAQVQAARLNLHFSTLFVLGGESGWGGSVSPIDEPQMELHVSGNKFADMSPELRAAAAVLARWSRVPWLRAALAKDRNARITTDGVTNLYLDAMGSSLPDDLRVRGRWHDLDYLRAHNAGALYITLNDAKTEKGSDWLLFLDGSMMLFDYYSGSDGFPYNIFDFDKLLGEYHLPGDNQYGGLIVMPDGTVDTRK